MPGVNVRTETRTGPATGSAVGAGRYMPAGMTERGPIDRAVRARSLAEWESVYGGAVAFSTLHADVRTHFEEGGSEVWTARKVGAAATVGTVSLLDGSTDPGLATVRIDAANPGAWSSRVSVVVEAGTAAGTRRLRVLLDGERVRNYDNLGTREAFVAALSRDPYVRASLVANATAAPLNLPRLATVTLSAGSDDRETVTAGNVTDALALFTPELGAGMVAVPGFPAASVLAAVLAHCKANERVGVLALPQNDTPTDALVAGPAMQSDDGEYLLLAYPWVRIPSATVGTQDVSPEGYVAAMRARAHLEPGGPTRAAFGEIATARFVLEPTVALTRAQGDALDEAGVSAIRTIAGTTRLYGYRSLSTNVADYALLIGRDTLNVVASEARDRLERYVGRTIDRKGQLYAEVAGTASGILAELADSGGLFPLVVDDREVDPGYSVDVGPAVNTTEVQLRNAVAVVMALRVSPVGGLVDVTIVKAGLTAAV